MMTPKAYYVNAVLFTVGLVVIVSKYMLEIFLKNVNYVSNFQYRSSIPISIFIFTKLRDKKFHTSSYTAI